MIAAEVLQARRTRFLDEIEHPVLLFAGGTIPRNYPANPHPYRADGSFLYFVQDPEPGAAVLFDPQERSVTLFLHERTAADALWHGPVPPFDAMKEKHAVTAVLDVDNLKAHLKALLHRRKLDSLAVADARATALAAELTGQDLDFADPDRIGRPALVAALARLRLQKDEAELAAMRQTAAVTREAHLLAITHTRLGQLEQQLAGIVDGAFARHGCVPAYNTILTVRGEVLHNHAHDNVLRETDVVLLDAGAESRSGYCSDVTRCWPVSGRFDAEGRAIYDLVLRANEAAIAMVAPGVRYRDVHLHASRVLAEGLVDIGLLRGRPDSLVEAGAHALFFPHGVGHLIGLEVHDMEQFGDQVHYPPGRERSEQFGLSYLRFDLDLTPGMTFTIEPGIYFVPAILNDPARRAEFKQQVAWDKAERFLTLHGLRGFGGIRIEDDVVCTKHGPEVLTASIPKAREVIEAMAGCAAM
jgi:Xaa-Pro aminopeptidase